MADGGHLENRYDVIILLHADYPILMKFGVLTESHMPMTMKRSKSKPEVEIQYGGRLFSETGSSNILATD